MFDEQGENSRSLQETMNVVAASLALEDVPAPLPRKAPETSITEIEAFAALDPLLADLRKRFLNARAQRMRAAQDFGTGDGMTDMAQYAEDSAWCAMQTRYMEVRGERQLMDAAQALMEENAEDMRLRAQEEKERDTRRAAENIALWHSMHDAPEQKNYADLWLFALYVSEAQKAQYFRLYQPMHQFNRLAA